MTIFRMGRPCWGKIFLMNEMPFPKPPAAEPLPLEIWLDRPDRAEVGREPFFRGRDAEFEVFRRAASTQAWSAAARWCSRVRRAPTSRR